MSAQINVAGEQLENAFELFNQFSEKLAESYSDLESHVTQLTKELAESHSARLTELAEKEVLAIKLEGLLDALPAGIVVLDAKDCITQTNPIARQMLALDKTRKTLTGNKWDKIAQASIITDGDELRLKKGSWAGRWVNVTSRALSVDVMAAGTGKIILISDITENRILQNKLGRQQRLTALGEMVASLAHQIRTPLASALLYISTLNHPLNDDNERIRYAKKARERLHHLERMVNDMLIFARGDVAESEYINAYDFMFKLQNLFAAENKVKNRQLDIDETLREVNIQANHDVLLSAIQNIIDNAIQAGSETAAEDGVSITIEALLNTDKQFEITIADNGCGMSDEIKERILEPFFTTRTTGTGLGLAVVSATVNRYRGELIVESEEGVGSKFTITFPRAEVAGLLPSNLSVITNLKNNKVFPVNQQEQIIVEQEVTL